MIRRAAVLLVLIACLPVGSLAASAQDKPLKVLFRATHTFAMDDLNAAIVAALSQPPFTLVTAPAPGVVIITIPDPVETQRGKVSGATYNFKMVFSRDGNPLGESFQSCLASKLSDCTDQITADVKTAAAER